DESVESSGGSCACPLPQQIVIDVEQLVDRRVFRNCRRKLLDRRVEIEEQLPLAVVAYHALDPEERSEADAMGNRLEEMQTGARVQDQVTGRKSYPVRAKGVGDHQFAALIILGCAEKKRRREIGSHPMRGAGDRADRAVDMRAIGLSAFI